jgi:hypothetical protein
MLVKPMTLWRRLLTLYVPRCVAQTFCFITEARSLRRCCSGLTQMPPLLSQREWLIGLLQPKQAFS